MSLLLLAGCTAPTRADEPRAASPVHTGSATEGSATGSASAVPGPTPADEWPVTTDPDTGVSFALPGTTQRETRQGSATTPNIRLYKAQVNDAFGMSVGLTEAAWGDYSAEGIDQLPDTLAQQFQAAGADDVAVTDRATAEVAGRPALDFRMSFTAKNGKRTVFLVRAIGDRTRMIQLQSILIVQPADEDAGTDTAVQYHQQLVGTLRLP
jgi:hypothetical protein